MKMKKANKPLPGQLSIFDGQKVQGILGESMNVQKSIHEELLSIQESLDKQSLEEWSAELNAPQKDMKDCLLIAYIHLTDAVEQLRKASAIEFQVRISNSLQ